MTTLVANIPPVKVWVRREYLRDLRDGHGEYTPDIGLHASHLRAVLYTLRPILQNMVRYMTSFLLVRSYRGARIAQINRRHLLLI